MTPQFEFRPQFLTTSPGLSRMTTPTTITVIKRPATGTPRLEVTTSSCPMAVCRLWLTRLMSTVTSPMSPTREKLSTPNTNQPTNHLTPSPLIQLTPNHLTQHTPNHLTPNLLTNHLIQNTNLNLDTNSKLSHQMKYWYWRSYVTFIL